MARRSHRQTIITLGVALLLALATLGAARGNKATSEQRDRPFPVEYYYKVRWGYFNEFLELYKRNHYPILQKLQDRGDIVDMSAARPFYHGGEDARWDFRFTIVWKNADVAHSLDRVDEMQPTIRELYPDQKKFVAEEQRRFELLQAHMDVPIVSYDLEQW